MVDPRHQRIFDHLNQTIPHPRPPKAKAQKSWAGLKVGQKLVNKVTVAGTQTGRVAPNRLWTVTKVDSLGMDLAFEDTGRVLRWSIREWGGVFSKAKIKRKGKKNG